MSQEAKEDDMTPEERLDWLRERGVMVETPEDRKRQQVVAAMKQADAIEQNITYVKVPADTSKPLEELHFQPKLTGDQLVEHLKSAMSDAGSENVDIELLKSQTSQTLTGTENVSVSDQALRQVAQTSSVEVFALVHPCPSNNFVAINIYLDEVGMLKRLALNARASDYAKRAGFVPAPVFYGDVYLGRIQQKPTIKHLPFLLGPDTSLDAPWLQSATTDNVSYQLEMNKLTGRNNKHVGVDGSDGNTKQEDGYCWTQTEQELEIIVKLPETATSKQISVKFRPQKLDILYEKDVKVSLSLFERVDVDACTWTLEATDDYKKLIVTMEKLEEAYWPRIKD